MRFILSAVFVALMCGCLSAAEIDAESAIQEAISGLEAKLPGIKSSADKKKVTAAIESLRSKLLKDKATTESKKNDNAPEVMNIEEINTDGPEMHPWLSDDGLTIYWAIWGQGVENWIWTAHRKTPQSLFEDKKRLFRGHSPVVAADGTELIFTSADSPQLMMAKRGTVEKEFERPTSIRELKFDEADIPAARSISNDALTMYVLKKRPKEGIWDIWITHRKNRNVQWDVLERLQVSVEDNVRLSDPFVTPDHLHLYVTVVDDADSKNVRIGILKRDDTSKPFSNLQLLDLNDAKGKLPNCSAPRYVSATHELFVSSAKLFRSDEQTKKRGFDLWVIKDFDPSFGQ